MAKKQKEEKVLDKIVEESKDKKVVFKSDFSEGVKDVDGYNIGETPNLQDFKSDVERISVSGNLNFMYHESPPHPLRRIGKLE